VTGMVERHGGRYLTRTNRIEQISGEPAKLIATKRENAWEGTAFPVSMLTATVFFAAVGSDVAANLTLQGVHDLTTNNETGSVSAASPQYADMIGGTFAFDAAAGVLTILSPAQPGIAREPGDRLHLPR
ncbi:MAG: hypothetical protein QOH21_256, partial [Acidobacteriota bacterium]|nr:hypothetical protein [Acidobacteriota bacterium]